MDFTRLTQESAAEYIEYIRAVALFEGYLKAANDKACTTKAKWPESVAYTEDCLAQAKRQLKNFEASYLADDEG